MHWRLPILMGGWWRPTSKAMRVVLPHSLANSLVHSWLLAYKVGGSRDGGERPRKERAWKVSKAPLTMNFSMNWFH